MACRGESGCRDCNVIPISLDTLRADRLCAYGYDRDTSPVIDEFAAESFVFTDVVAQFAATPGSRSMFTGDYRPSFDLEQACGRQLIGEELTPSDIEFVSAFYDGGIRWADTQLGQILAELEPELRALGYVE